MSLGLLSILTFLAALLAVIGVYSVLTDLFLRDRSRVSRRVDQEFRQRQRDRIRKAGLFRGDLVPLAAEAAGEEDRPTVRRRFTDMVGQSGLTLTPDRLVVYMAVAGLTLGGLAGLIRQNLLVAAVGAGVGALVPFLYVFQKRKARMAKMMRQLPDAFDLMSRVVRAGQTTSQALQAVADEFDQPLAGEFTFCVEQQNLGMSTEDALRDLARRTGLLEIKIFVLALLVQQQSGGNLAEILDKLAHVVRERFRIQGKISALTAEGRLQALVLLVIPIAIMGFMTAANRDYADALSRNPWLIGVMLGSEALGALWIHKIINFDH
ncbi:MAG TPA: type II secretion system F family protein [Gemmataceae bacterium]|nr:type II secretion system F family protein [Gemmataceae bacterium]